MPEAHDATGAGDKGEHTLYRRLADVDISHGSTERLQSAGSVSNRMPRSFIGNVLSGQNGDRVGTAVSEMIATLLSEKIPQPPGARHRHDAATAVRDEEHGSRAHPDVN
jgi:hypothetical protein